MKTSLIVAVSVAGLAFVCAGSADATTVRQVSTDYLQSALKAKSHSALEGGATDGTYWYSANFLAKGDYSTYDTTQLSKTKLGTSTPVKTVTYSASATKIDMIGHAQTMTYNPDTKKLYVAAWVGDTTSQNKVIRVVDPTTLQVTGTVTLTVPHTVYSICYDQADKTYIVGGGLGTNEAQYYVLNSSFEQVSASPVLTSIAGVNQGLDCDANYYYVQTHNPGTSGGVGVNDIYAFNHAWNRLAVQYQYSKEDSGSSYDYEGEHLIHAGNTFMLGVNDYHTPSQQQRLYRLINFQYTIDYAAGTGGSGAVRPTVVFYGNATALAQNGFTRSGYTFAGWSAYRNEDGKTRYWKTSDHSVNDWYAAQPSGYSPYLYPAGTQVSQTAARGTVVMTAVWTK